MQYVYLLFFVSIVKMQNILYNSTKFNKGFPRKEEKMLKDDKILVGKNSSEELSILLPMANRHGLITGASGSGKTITLKVMAESFSAAGVPVFLADVKGDLAATCLPGEINEKIQSRLDSIDISDFQTKGFPVTFWDVFGKNGHPIRTTLQDVGPTILSRMLGLNETQEGILSIIFRVAKDNEYALIDLKDLKALLTYVANNSREYTLQYGNVATQSVGAIQRAILTLEEQSGSNFFAEPDIDIHDFFKTNDAGLGYINILDCVELFKKPKLYSCFLLWLLTELSHELPEVGDLDKPKMVFFFDEAHLLFDELPSYMLTQITQVVKLIRSKGIGLYFISQSPDDVPGEILAQLGNKVQHVLRAYTPAEQKVIKAVASSYRTNPAFDTEEAITTLGTGEALVSFLTEKGEPGIVEKVTILPPQSQMGTLDDAMRLMIISRSEYNGKYDTIVDNISAFEILNEEMERQRNEEEEAKRAEEERKAAEKAAKEAEKQRKEEERIQRQLAKEAEIERKNSTSYKVGKVAKRTANTALNTVTRKMVNQILKGIFK